MTPTVAFKTAEEVSSYEQEMIAVLHGLLSLRRGERGKRLPVEWTGLAGKVADAFNQMIEMNENLAEELGRLSRSVGKEGRISQRLAVAEVNGFWRDSVDHVNELIDDL